MPRLPPSLKWLIDRRGRIDGEIQRIERYLDRHRRVFEKFQTIVNELSHLKETLTSIDQTLLLHKIKIDPQLIPAICPKGERINLPYGELTKYIYRRIAMGNGQPVSSKEIVEFIKNQNPSLKYEAHANLRSSVQKRLKNLRTDGKLVRHSPKTVDDLYGWWSFPQEFTPDTQILDDDLEHNL